MERKDMQHRRGPLGLVSRRGLLKVVAAAAAVRSAPVMAQSGRILAYVGAYTPNGAGIHIFSVNPSDGELRRQRTIAAISPSSIAFSPSRKYLYAVNEISNFAGTTHGSVTSFGVDQSTGDLRPLNVVDSGGSGPAHVSVDPSGKWVLASNYGSGQVAVIPVQADGSLGAATQVVTLSGPLGQNPAVDAPPRSFARSGHDRTHAHQTVTDQSGNYAFTCDLGTDRVFIWKFDRVAGALSPADQPFLQASNGAGPRHLDIHPNGRWVYVITEEASTMMFATFDVSQGSLTLQQTESTLPFNYEGTNYNSAVAVSPDGNYVYGANRLHDTIVVFGVDGIGGLTYLGETPTGGDYPRDFGIDPTGNFMYVLNQRSDHIAQLSINRSTGLLTHTGNYFGVGSPSRIAFLTL